VSPTQNTLFPTVVDDYIREDNPVRFIDAYVDSLPMEKLGFERAVPADIGRPSTIPEIYSNQESPSAFSPVVGTFSRGASRLRRRIGLWLGVVAPYSSTERLPSAQGSSRNERQEDRRCACHLPDRLCDTRQPEDEEGTILIALCRKVLYHSVGDCPPPSETWVAK
jgi:hypothetical protein